MSRGLRLRVVAAALIAVAGWSASPVLAGAGAQGSADGVSPGPRMMAASRLDVSALRSTGSRTRPIGAASAAPGQPASSTAPRLRTGQLDAPVATSTTSANWSGYSVGPGPYTSVTGSFSVPTLAATAGQTTASEWVGIDGAGSSTSLIQAGVQETYSPDTNVVYTSAWWEILPAPSTLITSMEVKPGDSVTVSISQADSSNWQIIVTDRTSGQAFTTVQAYAGPATSAEWIVEAPSSLSGVQETLGAYSPPVTFSDVGATGPQATLTAVTMVQRGVTVSVPSTWTESGFTVSYAPPLPATPAPTPPPGSAPGARVSVYEIATGQQVSLSASGAPYALVEWQRSPDATTWTPLVTVTLDAAGSGTYTFAPAQTAYYRAWFPSVGRYGETVIEVVVTPQPSLPSPTLPLVTPPSAPGAQVPAHDTAVPPAGATTISTTEWLAGPGLATSLGGAIVHAVASSGLGPIAYFRSVDGGRTFAHPVTLTTPGARGYTPALAAGPGGLVVAAWAAPVGAGVRGVMVTRSTDFGTSWSVPVLISAGDVRTGGVAVTSAGADHIVASWLDDAGQVTMRLSPDGAVTFGAIHRIGLAAAGSGASIALSSGTLLAAWRGPTGSVVLRRNASGEPGAWSGSLILGAAASGFPVLLGARDETVAVAYTVHVGGAERAVLRISTDGGGHWSAPRPAPAATGGEGVIGVVLQGQGRVQLITTRTVGSVQRVFLVPASNNGLAWARARPVSSSAHDAVPMAVTLGSRTLVLWRQRGLTGASGGFALLLGRL